MHVAVVPHFVIADGGEDAPRQAGGVHLIVRGWQLLQHIFIHELPVRVLRRRGPLPAPPNHVAGIENELGPPSLDISYDLASDPLAAMEAENCPAHARKQFDVLDRCLSDPTLVYRQRRDFAPGIEGHNDLHQLTGDRIIDELDVFPDDLFCDFLWKHQIENIDHQLEGFFPLIRLVREVHHRP